MANYHYYLGPLLWTDLAPFCGWRAPDGVVGMVDLGSLPDCALTSGDHRPLAFLASSVELGSGYDLLGAGDCREIATDGKMRQTWKGATGYQPSGDRLIDLLADHMTNGADPDGQAACLPLVPTADLSLEIHLAGHSRVWAEKFAWGKSKHTNKIKALLKAGAKACKEASKSQKQIEHYEKTLGALERKYGAGVAKELDKDAKPKKPSTSYSESFNKTDSSTLGPDLTWTEVANDMQVVSNKATPVTNTAWCRARAEHDVSSADHWTQATIEASGAGTRFAEVLARCASAADTAYAAAIWGNSGGSTNQIKIVAGTLTNLAASPVTGVGSVDAVLKFAVSGSTLTTYLAGASKQVSTDTAISGGTRGGIAGYRNGAYPTFNDWSIDDGIVPGHPTRKRFGGVSPAAFCNRGIW